MGAAPPPDPTPPNWLHDWKKPAAIIGLLGLVGGGLWTLWLYWSQDQPAFRAEQIRKCIKAHALRSAEDEYWFKDDESERIRNEPAVEAGSTHVMAFCRWPALDYSDPDGYSEIVVSSEDGPQDTEASSASRLDRITSPCPTLELHYIIRSMGQGGPLEPYEVELGEVVWAHDGEPWDGEVLPGRDFPSAHREDEIVAVRNFSLSLDRAACV